MLPPENIYGHTKKLRYILAQLEALADRLGRPPRVLDFGCGNGEAISQFIIAQGVEYTGVDFHTPSIEHARARFTTDNARFIDHAPTEGTYDALVYSDVLEHLDHPSEVLQEHRPLLSDHGVLIGSVPNGYGPFEMEKRIGKYTGLGWLLTRTHRALRAIKHRFKGTAGQNTSALPYNADNGHVQFYTVGSLGRVLSRGGYAIDDFAKGCFIGSSCSVFLLRGQPVMRLNNAVAEVLPHFAVSTWYFTAKLNDDGVMDHD